MPIMQERSLRAAGAAHDPADRNARDHALLLGASGRGTATTTSPGSALDQSRVYQPSLYNLQLVIRAFKRKQGGVILLDLSEEHR
jgi:hypothetical protein